MSKLSFRARALDVTKPMQVLRPGDVPDLPDFGINRAVPQLPTGMEKEEESVSISVIFELFGYLHLLLLLLLTTCVAC